MFVLQPNKKYSSKWIIGYKGKAYAEVYGKKKAYDLFVSLSHCLLGLEVQPAPRSRKQNLTADRKEYHRQWRARNKDKVRAYNLRSRQKQKQGKMKRALEEGETQMAMEQRAADDGQEAYDHYMRWVRSDIPEELRRELEGMTEERIQESFGKHLAFGTGGLRAELGAGTNRMNVFTVRRITQGLADYLKAKGSGAVVRGAAIAYDSRRLSQRFAEEAALVLARNGIKAYLFEELRPTPILSFAVRQLQTAAGIVITASHNPPEYNGYKVYGEDGGQVAPDAADAIAAAIDDIDDELAVETMPRQEALIRGLLVHIGRKIDIAYYLNMQSQLLQPSLGRMHRAPLRIVYTALHGAGRYPVRDVLRMAGYQAVFTVAAQERPDPEFSTVASPNPEEPEALRLAIELAEKVEAELVMGTDPDADRVGLAVRNRGGAFECLTGNQTGALLLEFTLSRLREQDRLPANGVVIKTIVTSELGRAIASAYGVETLDTLTGFKYIGEKIGEYERTGEKQFLFGYEESCGYLAGTFVRDKDAVQACLLIAEMAAYYRSIGLSVHEALMNLYEKYGYYREALHSITLAGLEGVVRMNRITEYMRKHRSEKLGGAWKVRWIRDYQYQEQFDMVSRTKQPIELPRSNVLKYILDDNCWFAVRPSGTEPKLKIYFGAVGDSEEETAAKLESLRAQVLHWVDNIQNYIGLEVTVR